MASAKASTATAPASRKIDLKEAVAIAVNYFRGLFPAQAKENLMLEELEESKNGKYWLITLGYDFQRPPKLQMFGPELTRDYKTLTDDKRTGEVLAVKIRKVT